MEETTILTPEQEQLNSQPQDIEPVTVPITVQTMLESGAHFGHKTSNWNPKMAPFLYGSRNDVYVFNLEKTLEYWNKARQVIVDTVAKGGELLVVGTKKQCKDVVKRECIRCGCLYVDNKWVGGTLTNFNTIKATINKMKKLEEFLLKVTQEGSAVSITKKERILIERDVAKLKKQLGGIENIKKLPDLLFIIDIDKHKLAAQEATACHIPTIAIADSNVNPDKITYIVPANDDSIGSLNLFITNVADAVLEGKALHEQQLLTVAKDITDAKEVALIEEKNAPIVEKRKLKKREKKLKPFFKRQVAEGITVYTAEAFEKEKNT